MSKRSVGESKDISTARELVHRAFMTTTSRGGVAPLMANITHDENGCTHWSFDFEFQGDADRAAAERVEPKNCRRCSECEGADHHWTPDDGGDAGPDYACKHCSATAWCCTQCDAAVSSADTECAECAGYAP